MKKPKQPETEYAPKEIAEILGVSLSTVSTLLRTGELKSLKDGLPGTAKPRYRVRESDLIEYLNRNDAE